MQNVSSKSEVSYDKSERIKPTFTELSFGGTTGLTSLRRGHVSDRGTPRGDGCLPKPDTSPATLFAYKLPYKYLTGKSRYTINESLPTFLCPICLENPFSPPALP